MPDTYSKNLGLTLMAFDDENWDVVLNNNLAAIDAQSPVGALAVSTAEAPSASLNVRVASGSYRKLDGTVGTYAGMSSLAITPSSTVVLYLDGSGMLQVSAAYPTAAPYIPLATVVAGASTITSITDNRSPAFFVGVPTGGALINAANDTTAASAGVPVGGLYRNGSVLMVRVS